MYCDKKNGADGGDLMSFNRFGKAYHLVIEGAQGLRNVLTLDDSHWAATSAPTNVFRDDAAMLRYIDEDDNGRILTDEVRHAVRYLLDLLRDDSKVGSGIDSIAMDAINPDAPGAAAILTTAKYVCEQTQRTDGIVELANVRACMASLKSKPLNGDGILISEAAGDNAALKEYIEAAVSATGGSPDISGKTGISAAQISEFAAAIKDFLAWKAQGDVSNTDTMPLGADTPAVYNLFARHSAAIDRFFFLAGFLRYDPTNAEKYIQARSSESPTDALDAAPLARPLPDGSLPLDGAFVNPLHAETLKALRDGLFGKVLGLDAPKSVTEDQWAKVKAVMSKHALYLASKKGAIVEGFSQDKLESWTNPEFTKEAERLQVVDKEVANRVAAFSDLEKLILFHNRLPRFVNNFVSLTEFYNPEAVSLFERGRLLVDGRWFNLCIEIPDPGVHATVAKNSGIFTMYLKVTPIDKTLPPYTIVSAATAGTRGNLAVGKRGVFYDLQGREADAVITSILEAPISLKEAILAPFQAIGASLLGKIDAMANKAKSDIESAGDSATTDLLAGKAPVAPTAAAPAGGGAANMGGLFMGVSVAIAALGSAFAFLAKTFSSMSFAARIYTAIAAVMVVLGPILLGGIIKLKRQDMGPILEGCGWAVNASMKLTHSLRRQFTLRKPYPRGAEGTPCHRVKCFIAVLLAFVVTAAIAAAVVLCR